MAAIDSKKSTPYEAGTLKGIISGSLRLQQRLFVAGLVTSPVCPFCNQEEETLEHCFWKCPRWHMSRAQSDIPSLAICDNWSPCTRECGIFVEHEEVLALKIELEDEEHDATRMLDVLCTGQIREQASNMSQYGRVSLWTDGACTNNQDHRLRRAGCGIFYSQDHVLNLSCILPGRTQSNQRAELLAVVLALRRDPRDLDIRTDSDWVYQGSLHWRSWVGNGWKGDHGDLWKQLASELASRSDVSVVFTKVKGHATDLDVERGRVDACDKFGNDGADLLAVDGAASHCVAPGIVARTHARKAAAQGLHQMMLEIVRQRRLFEAALRGEVLAEDEVPEFEGIDDDEQGFVPNFDHIDVAIRRVPVDTDPG